MAFMSSGPLKASADDWNDIKHHYDQGEPDDWDGEEQDEEAIDDHDRRFDDFYSTQQGDIGDQAFDLDNPPF